MIDWFRYIDPKQNSKKFISYKKVFTHFNRTVKTAKQKKEIEHGETYLIEEGEIKILLKQHLTLAQK